MNWLSWFKSLFQSKPEPKPKLPPSIRTVSFWAIVDQVAEEGWCEEKGWTDWNDGMELEAFDTKELAEARLATIDRLCAEVVQCEGLIEEEQE